ncbi:hypothetical protein L0128_07845 [candidate division KSB1 bacterium]|nr:hypothetical protein [candidate division KSB1 bacterium]
MNQELQIITTLMTEISGIEGMVILNAEQEILAQRWQSPLIPMEDVVTMLRTLLRLASNFSEEGRLSPLSSLLQECAWGRIYLYCAPSQPRHVILFGSKMKNLGLVRARLENLLEANPALSRDSNKEIQNC